jgi:hypothetical protein
VFVVEYSSSTVKQLSRKKLTEIVDVEDWRTFLLLFLRRRWW